jgi:hypothetical protein
VDDTRIQRDLDGVLVRMALRRACSSGGLTFRKRPSRSRSYTILRIPAISSGQPNADAPRSEPARSGPMAEARLRGTDVTLAAAGRSGG